MELFARLALDCVWIRIQMIDVLAHLSVFPLQIFDFLLQGAVFDAFLLPNR